MLSDVTVACVQAEPVLFDLEATIDRVGELTAEAAAQGASLVVFPESFVPCYPSNRWVRHLAAGSDPQARAAFARLVENAVEVPGPACDRLGSIAREHGVWLCTGVTERAGGTIYNTLLLHAAGGSLAIHHRKLMPTNHERMIWGQGDGGGLATAAAPFGRVGGLICWENLMPLARFALYADGIEIYLAPTDDTSDAWQDSMRHIARESRCYVITACVLQRASSHPPEIPLVDGPDLMDRGGSAILSPSGEYLAGPLWEEPGILVARLDGSRLREDRQRFDPAGHYHRPDVFSFSVSRPG